MTRRGTDALVVSEARRWIGTPYRHQGSARGIGCDCLGLLRGVWRSVVGEEPLPVPPYTADWAEWRADEPLLSAAERLLDRQADAAGPGTVLMFRWVAGAAVKHCGIMTTPDAMVHAYSGIGVVESPLTPSWRRRVVAPFAFPRTTGPRRHDP